MLKSETFRRILLVLGSLAFGIGVLEVLAFMNIVDYRVLFAPPARDRFDYTDVVDRELLHVHPAHSHFAGSARGGEFTTKYQIPRSDMTLFHWDVRYDQNGFRNDRDLTSADVAVIGDSFVENMTTPTDELVSSQLARLEGKVVANLGQYGYGPIEELAVLKRYALPLHPHTVLWLFYEANDLKDVVHFHKDGRRLPRPAEPPKPGPQPSFVHVVLAAAHAQLKLAFRPSGKKREGIIALPDGRETRTYFNYSADPLNQNDLNALDETASTLATAEKLTEQSGARFVFVFIPMKFRALRSHCRFPAESECRNWVLTDMPERLRSAVGPVSPQIGYLDLTQCLSDVVKQGELPYYPDDDHWSPVGQKAAAEAIDRYLARMPA